MQAKTSFLGVSLSFVLLFISTFSFGQTDTKEIDASKLKEKKHRTGSMYLSWGYNTEWYSPSTVHVDQPSLGNSYDMVSVNAHDHRGWDEGLFSKDLTIPQYNYRLGYYFNEKQDMAIELNFDHTKYLIVDNQLVHIRGTINGAAVDSNIVFSNKNGFYYFLNNGANFFLFNFVKRWGLYRSPENNLAVDFTEKLGVGPLIPHVQNSLFGQANTPQFQFGGWNTGVESAIRMTVKRYAYLELSYKFDYASYSNLEIYKGTAYQSFSTAEVILSGGIYFPTTKGNRFFSKEVTMPSK